MFLPCTKREKGLARVKQSACLGAAIPHVFFVYYSKTWSYPFFKFRNGKCKFNARCSFYIHVVSAILSRRGGGGGGVGRWLPFLGWFFHSLSQFKVSMCERNVFVWTLVRYFYGFEQINSFPLSPVPLSPRYQ